MRGVRRGPGHRGPFSRSSIGPGLTGREKEAILSLRQTPFPTRKAPALCTDHLQARGQLITFLCRIRNRAQVKSVWPGGWGRYLILLTAQTRESQLLGERLSLSSQLALASLFPHGGRGRGGGGRGGAPCPRSTNSRLAGQRVSTLHNLLRLPGLQLSVIFNAFIDTLREGDREKARNSAVGGKLREPVIIQPRRRY